MTTGIRNDAGATSPALRLWPGVVLLLLQWFMRFALPAISPEALAAGVFGSLIFGLLILVWWAFFSKATRVERWGGSLILIVVMFVTPLFLHESVRTGMMGLMFVLFAIPLVSLALVIAAFLTRDPGNPKRLTAFIIGIIVACGFWTLLRSEGINNDGSSAWAWRWSKSLESKYATSARAEDFAQSIDTLDGSDIRWPGFRGEQRNGIVRAVAIEEDWQTNPPSLVWRRAVGPAWSSFAVLGNLIYTQEQIGESESISCYQLETGEPVWRREFGAHFWQADSGAGPRSTPVLSGDRLIALGATGLLTAVNALDGTVHWSRDLAKEFDAKVAYYGFSGSPVVFEEKVIVAISGQLAAFNLESGEREWIGPAGGSSYASPHIVTIDGIPQVVLLHGKGATSLAPEDGSVLWEHQWPQSTGILQPALLASGDLLLSTGETRGVQRLKVDRQDEQWRAEMIWDSHRLKPYFSDIVVHKGHAYGFDGRILACIELESGERRWKGGRYGSGQLLLLPEQDLILLLAEKGKLITFRALPDELEIVGSVQSIEGKTWNHPVMVGDMLLVRNDREMAAYRLDLRKAP